MNTVEMRLSILQSIPPIRHTENSTLLLSSVTIYADLILILSPKSIYCSCLFSYRAFLTAKSRNKAMRKVNEEEIE